MRILKAAEDIVRDRLLRQNRVRLNTLLDKAVARDLDPAAARKLLGEGVRRRRRVALSAANAQSRKGG